MNATETIETPLYVTCRDMLGRPAFDFLGFFPPEYLRPLLSRKEARFQKVHNQRACVLTETAPAALRVRALSSSSATKSLSTTYTEDLYPDSPETLAHKKNHDIAVTVTATTISLKKYRGPDVGFVPYGPTEGFRRRRFNPDYIKPLFWSARAAELALRPSTPCLPSAS